MVKMITMIAVGLLILALGWFAPGLINQYLGLSGDLVNLSGILIAFFGGLYVMPKVMK